MGKRSSFERNPRDYYPTPEKAVLPLLPFLPPNATFTEPCAGDGRLVAHLEKYGNKCVFSSDIEPVMPNIQRLDALHDHIPNNTDLIITNPPWDRKILHPMISKFITVAPTWLLFDADWMHTKQASPFLPYCRKIVSIGRVKWIEESKTTGKDNCCWYLFTSYNDPNSRPLFYGKGQSA